MILKSIAMKTCPGEFQVGYSRTHPLIRDIFGTSRDKSARSSRLVAQVKTIPKPINPKSYLGTELPEIACIIPRQITELFYRQAIAGIYTVDFLTKFVQRFLPVTETS